jgi:2-polyprenyl-3-methyl-5-hydroxy-6-metoxy-1,4-benzoquinol methylase
MEEFDKFASDYGAQLDRSVGLAGESSAYFVEYKVAYVGRILGSLTPAKILDFGCGVGSLSDALATQRPQDQIHGFDVSAESLNHVAPDLKNRGLFTSDLGELHRDYDLIVVSSVLHHITPERRQATINDLAARLSCGGRILVIEHNPLNPLTRWVVSHCPFDEDAILLWPREVKRYFSNAGLRTLRREYIVFFPRALARLRRFEPQLAWCPAGAQYALTAAA